MVKCNSRGSPTWALSTRPPPLGIILFFILFLILPSLIYFPNTTYPNDADPPGSDTHDNSWRLNSSLLDQGRADLPLHLQVQLVGHLVLTR